MPSFITGNLKGAEKISDSAKTQKENKEGRRVQAECYCYTVLCYGLHSGRRKCELLSPGKDSNYTPLNANAKESKFLFLALFYSFMDCIYRLDNKTLAASFKSGR